MEMTYRDIPFREADGSIRTYRIPTISIPDDFYDKSYAEWLKKIDPAGYIEYMHEVEETFIAMYFGG